ncbi:MAG: SGNH/GDSL hydrolase family protein [Acidimicrobiia bacterium]
MAAAAIAGMLAVPLHATPAAAAPPIYVETESPSPGPRGSIAVIGDSVMLGSVWETGGYGPSLGAMLAGDGWGPVTSKAGVGFQTGRFLADGHGANMATWITNRRRLGWDATTFVVNLGANEVSSCFQSVECAVRSIDGFLDLIGPGHQVWWAKITMPDAADAATWNAALDAVAGRRSELLVWDWPAVIASSGIPMSGDGVHLPTASAYRTRSRLIADDVAARRGSSLPIGASAAVPVASGDPVGYSPLPPERVLDTRATGDRLPALNFHTLDLSGHLPADATAVSVNIAADDPATAGFLTAWPCDAAMPTTSSLNMVARSARGAHALVALDDSRRLCIFSSTATELIVDLQGVFSPTSIDRLDPFPPERLADTRQTGRSQVVRVPTPPGATAVVLNITATGSTLPGYLTAFPCGGTMPTVANVNFRAGETVGGAAFVPAGEAGGVCIYSNVPTDVVVDLTGAFSPTGALRFVPGVPARMLDTRDGTGGWTGRLGRSQTVELAVAPIGAQAVSGTLTMVDPALDAHLTAFPGAGPLPLTASLNAARAGVVANSVTVGISPSMGVNAAVSSHVVFDTTGWWVP